MPKVSNAELAKQIALLSEHVMTWTMPEEIRKDIAAIKEKVGRLDGVPADLSSLKSDLMDKDRGIYVRVDRLEQSKGWTDKLINAAIAAGVAMGFSFLRPHQ